MVSPREVGTSFDDERAGASVYLPSAPMILAAT
jgi:hypothetical protein